MPTQGNCKVSDGFTNSVPTLTLLLEACKASLEVLRLDSDMEEDFRPEIDQLEAAIAAAKQDELLIKQ